MTEPPSQVPAPSAEAVTGGARSGSPFAAGSGTPGPSVVGGSQPPAAQPEPTGEGVYRETAAAAAYAAWMLLTFAGAGYAWFPSGGIAVALLGCAMGMAGLGSRWIKLSIAALIGHTGILLGCYLKLL